MANTKFQSVLDSMANAGVSAAANVSQQSSVQDVPEDVSDTLEEDTEELFSDAEMQEMTGENQTSADESLNVNETDSVMESIKLQLSDGLESYYIAQANGGFVSSQMISRLYIMSQFVDGEIDGATLNQQMEDVKNNLYNDMDAQAWVVSFTRENNPYHYEPEAMGRAYGETRADMPDLTDVTVDLSETGLSVDTALSAEQLKIINELNGENLTEEEKTEYFSRLVSDNYSVDNDITDLCDGDVTKLPADIFDTQSGNLVVDDGSGVKLDVSEMTIGRKTRLTGDLLPTNIDENGKSIGWDEEGMTAEEYLKQKYQEEITAIQQSDKEWKEKVEDLKQLQENGVSLDVCGGTLTYKNNGSKYHFESEYMGEFDYDSSTYTLGYKQGECTDANGVKTVTVPVLHAGSFTYDDTHFCFKFQNPGKDSNMNMPEGIKVADYMYDGCSDLSVMPPLADSLVSAHCSFQGCTGMTRASINAKDGANDDFSLFSDTIFGSGKQGEGGTMSMPQGLEDASYMFVGCSNMTESFEHMGEQVWDARGMYQGCGKVEKMTDMSACQYLVTEMAANMYTGCNSDLQKDLVEYMEENNQCVSRYTEENRSLVESALNGVDINSERLAVWNRYVDAQNLIEKQDLAGGGAVTGMEALTAGLSKFGVQHTESGNIIADDSTWSYLRDNYDEPEQVGDSELLDRGLAFLGTMGISSAVLSGVTKSKWVGLIGGAAIAAVPQFIGCANKISPLLRTVGGMIGDNAFGNGLNTLADKLEGSKSTDNVKDVLDVEELFDNRQIDTKKYTEAILMTLTNTESNSDIGAGFYMKQVASMEQNGHLLAQDGNLDVIAYTSEEEFANCCNSAVMNTACDGMMEHINQLASESGTLTAEQKQEIGDSFVIMMQNMKAYSNGAMDELANCSDPAIYERRMAGLGKVMRNSTEPIYAMMAQADEKYGILTEEQKEILNQLAPEGTTTFSEYQESYNPETRVGDIGTPSVDIYVSHLETGVAAAKEAEATETERGLTEDERAAERMQYLEENYGWLMDLAEEHNVKVDTKVNLEGIEKDGTGAEVPEENTSKSDAEPELG